MPPKEATMEIQLTARPSVVVIARGGGAARGHQAIAPRRFKTDEKRFIQWLPKQSFRT
jgi:hypothetical protein